MWDCQDHFSGETISKTVSIRPSGITNVQSRPSYNNIMEEGNVQLVQKFNMNNLQMHH